MRTPGAVDLVILALAAYRVWRLAALDTILDRPRDWLLDRIDADYLVSCPWCLGLWISIAVWAAWSATGDWTLWLCVPLAISAGVGLVAKLDPPEA